jgi:hypothetical protein
VEYIVILVDKVTPETKPIETLTTKVTYHGVCTQMVGLRFRHIRPTHVVNGISEEKKRELGDAYQRWYAHEVQPILSHAKEV